MQIDLPVLTGQIPYDVEVAILALKAGLESIPHPKTVAIASPSLSLDPRLTTVERNVQKLLLATPSGTVSVDPAGAITGDGSSSTPLKVAVDGSTVSIVGDKLVATAGGAGITQLTGGVVAGPGVGSLVATVVSVAGASGLLVTAQTPRAHAASHASGGSDPVTVTTLAGFPGGTTTFLRADGTFAAAGSASHALLDGSVDSDTVAYTVLRGSMIVGNSTPKWGGLAVGSNHTVLKSNGSDPAWGQVDLANDVIGLLPAANITPAGSDTQIQYNNATVLAGAVGITYNVSTSVATFTNAQTSALVVNSTNASGGFINIQTSGGALGGVGSPIGMGLGIGSASDMGLYGAGSLYIVGVNGITCQNGVSSTMTINSTQTIGGFVNYKINGTSRGAFGSPVAMGLGFGANGDMCFLSNPGKLYIVAASWPTTAIAGNAVITDGIANFMQRSTSSRRYKEDIAPLQRAEWEVLLDLAPSTYVGKHDPPSSRFMGLIAEDVDRAYTNRGLNPTMALTYDADGRPEWVQYPHFVAPIIRMLQDHDSRLAALE